MRHLEELTNVPVEHMKMYLFCARELYHMGKIDEEEYTKYLTCIMSNIEKWYRIK